MAPMHVFHLRKHYLDLMLLTRRAFSSIGGCQIILLSRLRKL